MKKVLSLVLALAMVIGMSTVAFAASTTTVSSTNLGVLKQQETKHTVYLPISATQLEKMEATNNFTRWNTTTEITSIINGIATTLESNNARDINEIEEFLDRNGTEVKYFWEPVGSGARIKVELYPKKGVSLNRWLPTGNYSVKYTIDYGANPDTDYLVFSNVMFEVKAVTGTTADTVPSTYKIIGVADNWTDFVKWNGTDASNVFPEITEDTTLQFPLVAGMFTWEDQNGDPIVYATNNGGDPMTKVRTTHLKNIALRKTNLINNSGTVKSLEIDGTNVKLKTVVYFLKCGNTDVSLDLDLAYKSSASGDKLYISFNIYNDEVLVDAGQTDVDTTGHVYIKADESVRNLELQIGEGLSLFKGMGSGQKAYARVSLELSAGDEKLFQQYSELSDVYTLYTVGVASANVYAEFTDLDDTYFVYDENFKLLGTTADSKLPFSNKYYLTTKKVDLAGTASSEEPTDESSESTPIDTGNAGTGGGTAVVSNYNPNTGA